MDQQLLAALPDAAKLGILRILSQAPAASSQQAASRPLATAGAVASGVPPLLAGRSLTGGLAVIDGFLDGAEVKAARDEAQSYLKQQSRPAGMVAAKPGLQWASRSMRGDRATWLPDAASLEAAGHRQLAAVVRHLAGLQPWLQQQGYDVDGRFSCQLACYPGGGTRYVRHRDRSASVPYREVTCILYLNPEWQAEHGGNLCVYNHSTSGSDPCAASAADLRLAGGAAGSSAEAQSGSSNGGGGGSDSPEQQQQQEQHAVPSGLDEGHCGTVVPPLGGRLVLMDSRLLHEVLPSHVERYAIAVWFSRRPLRVTATAAQEARQQEEEQQQQPQGQQPQGQQLAPAAAACSTAHLAQQQEEQDQQQPHQQQQQQQQQQQAEAALDTSAITAPGCIFVSVPAYRDSETQWTLEDLFAKAKHPERVRVGVVWQLALPEDAPLMRLAGDQRWLAQIRHVVLPASETTGPCKARALAQHLWEGEEFHLQIDSHMRFVKGWDTALLRMLHQAGCAAGHPRVVLSHYPPGYEGTGPSAVLPAAPLPVVLCASGWGETDGLLRLSGRKLREPLAAPTPALFWAAGMSFSRAQLIREAPYPRDLAWLFFGEELRQLQHMFCAGWDVYTLPRAVAFHLWSRQHRPTFTQDRPPDAEQRRRSQQRVAAALAGTEGGRKGDGEAAAAAAAGRRSLQQFWEHTGVDFRSRTISDRARTGGLPADAFLSASVSVTAYC